ncbi:MAG: hypothetical protein RIS75_528 [Actinomycetota bacterium]
MKRVRMSEISITIDGEQHEVAEGISVAAALMSVQKRSWRLTRHNQQPRGVFCGIGVCFDCLVTINGVANVRACLDLVQPNDVITTQSGDRDAR